jgi:hypothetical protein
MNKHHGMIFPAFKTAKSSPDIWEHHHHHPSKKRTKTRKRRQKNYNRSTKNDLQFEGEVLMEEERVNVEDLDLKAKEKRLVIFFFFFFFFFFLRSPGQILVSLVRLFLRVWNVCSAFFCRKLQKKARSSDEKVFFEA